MDSSTDNSQILSTPSRKRPREDETPSQRQKREKAAERQRRKRQRDRHSMTAGMVYHPVEHQQAHHSHMQAQQPMQQQPQVEYTTHEQLTPEELVRRDRVRAAARERQRKHRLLVKQRKMRDLGLDMGNEIMPGMEEVHFQANAEGQYQPVPPHEMQQQQQQQQQQLHTPPNPHEPPFPQGQVHGGQTFATTLLLSFTCAPLLKQHLLRTLNMTNEELASLEPIIADAWDQWDQQRRMHYEQHHAAAAAAAANGAGPSVPYPGVDMTQHDPTAGPPNGLSYAPPPGADPAAHPTANEFRARFHRPLVAPSPFQSPAAAGGAATPLSSGGGAEAIDPHLGTNGNHLGANGNHLGANGNGNGNAKSA